MSITLQMSITLNLIFKNHEEQFIGSVRFDLDKNYLPNNYIISIRMIWQLKMSLAKIIQEKILIHNKSMMTIVNHVFYRKIFYIKHLS